MKLIKHNLERLAFFGERQIERYKILRQLVEFLFYNKAPYTLKVNPTHILLLISLILGFVYGAFVRPIWNEMVEWGQVLAGTIDLNFQNAGRGGDITLQTTLPAFLLKLGMSTKWVCLLTTGAVCSISFSAWTIMSYVFLRVPIFCLGLALFFLHYPYDNFHYYPVFYPYYFFIFGQVGFYLAFLVLGLLSLGRNLLAFSLLGWLMVVHAPWGLGMLVCLALYVLILRKKVGTLKSWVSFFVHFLFAIVLFLATKPSFHNKSIVRLIQSESLLPSLFNLDEIVNELGEKESLHMVGDPEQAGKYSKAREKDQNVEGYPDKQSGRQISSNILEHEQLSVSVRSDHNKLFLSANNPFKEIFKYFKNTLWLWLLVFILFRQRPDLFSLEVRKVLGFIFSISLFVTLFKIYEEIDPHMTFLNLIHPQLGALSLRTVVNRWMNFDFVVLPIMTCCLIGYYAFVERVRLALVVVAFIPLVRFMPFFNDHWPGFLLGQIFWVTCVFILLKKRPNRWLEVVGQPFARRWFGLVVSSGVLIYVATFLIKIITFQPFLMNDQYSKIESYLSKQDGMVILGPGVSDSAFNVSLRTGKATYYPDYIKIPIFRSNKVLNLYCHLDARHEGAEIEKITKECFEKRSIKTWSYIGYQMKVSHVLVREDYRLKLPLIKKLEGLALYKVQGILR